VSLKFYILLLLIFIFFIKGCSADVRFKNERYTSIVDSSNKFHNGQKLKGVSSYYGKKFHGRLTASGEVFDMHGYTAAHKELPFGTILNVKNLDNPQKSIQVRVNDRGPFVKNRILDLSYAAARQLGIIKTGTAQVEITILQLGK
jgi:rare lipoprotein A